MGTRFYVAPEMIRGTYNTQVDLWSAGIVAYLLLTKKVPFGGHTSEEAFENILRRTVGFPKECELSALAKDFVLRLLKKNPKRRMNAYEAL